MFTWGTFSSFLLLDPIWLRLSLILPAEPARNFYRGEVFWELLLDCSRLVDPGKRNARMATGCIKNSPAVRYTVIFLIFAGNIKYLWLLNRWSNGVMSNKTWQIKKLYSDNSSPHYFIASLLLLTETQSLAGKRKKVINIRHHRNGGEGPIFLFLLGSASGH